MQNQKRQYLLHRLTIIFLIFFSALQAYSQSEVVFSTDGKIIRTVDDKDSDDFKLIVENVTEKDSELFYLVLQFNKDGYLGKAKIAGSHDEIITAIHDDKDYVYFCVDTENLKNEPLISYQLVKTNSWGSDTRRFKKMFSSANRFQYYMDSLTFYDSIKDARYSGIPEMLKKTITANEIAEITEEIVNKQKSLDSIEQESKKYQNRLKKDQIGLQYKKKLLNLKLQTYSNAIDKLSLLDEVNGSANAIQEYTDSINTWNADLLKIAKIEANDSLAFWKNKLNSAKDNFKENKALNDALKGIEYSYIKTPFYKILYQGVLVNKNKTTKEIIYEFVADSIFESGKTAIDFVRKSPDLPQLTTDDKLFIKIININSENLENNRFSADLVVDVTDIAEEAEIINGPEIKTIEGVPFPKINFISRISKINDGKKESGSSEEGESKQDSSNCKKKKDSLIWMEWKDKVMDSDSFTYNDVKNWKQKYDSLTNKNIQKPITKLKEIHNAVHKVNKWIEKFPPMLDTVNTYFSNTLKIASNQQVPHFDFLLKYPIEFPYKAKPVIKLITNTYYYEDYEIDFKEAKKQSLAFQIKKNPKEVATDKLRPVRSRYRFALNAGVAWAPITNYSYTEQLVPGTNDIYYLEEKKSIINKFVPTLFLSYYLRKTDVFDLNRDFLERTHFDVGIDYYDTDLLDNFYVGLGYEPSRNIHLAAGFRFSNIERIDISKVNLRTLDKSKAQTTDFDSNIYLAINFGFNLIPTAVNSLISSITQ